MKFLLAFECVSEHGKTLCKSMGGQCIIERDGYYWISGVCVTFGLIFLVGFIIPTARKLQGRRFYEMVMTARFSPFVFRASDFKMESKDVTINLPPRLSASCRHTVTRLTFGQVVSDFPTEHVIYVSKL
jgi:Acetyl-coenzyme A transporter 1